MDLLLHVTVSLEILLETILQTAGWRDGGTSVIYHKPVVDEGCLGIALRNKIFFNKNEQL